ncbi:diguanylate cyclase/phosphodiesterase with PAS/PAC and MHYT sensor(s) [Gloeocapsa sp. PCC 7428]|uniref:bifunctional diguanylate cyclase/phosphodiesterase n=1 Tax=Gloeocapsa sp. PCC 7428 TaxID=1173026 RepID=UPI0002A607C1|nr:bifunctional diguanylate cyclase/phosphodiesterase [Gloeocapsa sp. PCC 7428]AFZ33024.1 diguanylate cyclase/phosphodiesterase with PAS/PAC and MHYT sensor(s) [Gloeocapsa sp. PCC 7428]
MAVKDLISISTALSATYDLRLVVLSLVVAIISSYTALDMAGQVPVTQGLARKLWLGGSAIALGISIWVMHFIAMLAYELPIPITYDIATTFLSLLVAIALCGVGLSIASRRPLGWLPLFAGGMFVGLGIVGMHFTAMWGMRLAAMPVYNQLFVIGAGVFTVFMSTSALWLAFHASAEKIVSSESLGKVGSAIFAGVAIDALHYLGMMAVDYYPSIKLLRQSAGIDRFILAISTGTAGLSILLLTSVGSYFGQRLSAKIANAEALRESEERYQKLFDFAPDAYFAIAADGTLKSVNNFAAEYLGYDKQELIGQPALVTVYEGDRDWMQEWMASIFREKITSSEVELRKVRKDGSVLWVRERNQLVIDNEGEPIELHAICRDITERKQAEEELLQNAFHDVLTGLPNRALFLDRLEQAIQHAKRYPKYLFAVLFLDLDRFKVINDSLGHLLGDKLLIAIATRLQGCVRPTDTVARLGGDEFTILLDGIQDASDTIRVAERIEQALTSPFEIEEQQIFTSASIGIALSSTNYDQPEALLRNADIAMYRAKNQGAGRYEIFNPVMYAKAVARLQLETDLRRAIERQEFILQYQPIISLHTGKITGFEALVRWQHPQHGLQYPDQFIATAEETGLITRLCQWVIHTACHQFYQWQLQIPEAKNVIISVNLSGKQFSQPNIVEQIQQILQQTNLAASKLRLEIVEGVIMEDNDSISTKLLQLRNLGVQLSIDDFGTGYSSLARLYHFPINGLKIDRSFVSRIGIEQASSEIVETIITLAHKLNIDVTAEGVETSAQLAYLKTLQCEYAQGFFISRSLSSDQVETLLKSNPQW